MAGGFRVWAFDLDVEIAVVAGLRSLLSADEAAHADRLRMRRVRTRYVAGRARMRQILGHCLGQPPASLRFKDSTFGKPALAAGGREPPLQFNASGSDGVGLLAVHATAAVGVDVERARPLRDFPALAHMLLSEPERAELAQIPAARQPARLLDYWTRKEALAKALGTGLREGLDRLSLYPWSGLRAHCLYRGSQALWVTSLRLPREGHVAALASTARVTDVRCEWWDPREAR
jgi:4'-phosphopantetheinyl transferase